MWEDHFSSARWNEIEDILADSPYVVESTGAYIGENKRVGGLVLALNHVLKSTTVSDCMTILWPNIQSIARIKRAD